MASPGSHTLTISGQDIETKTVAATVTSSGLVIGSITTSPTSDNTRLILVAVIAIAVVLVAVLFVMHKRKGKK